MTALTQAGRLLRDPAVLVMAALMAIAAAIRVPFFDEVAWTAVDPPMSDSIVWMVWTQFIWEHGLHNMSDIEPETYIGYHYVFWAVSQIYGLFSDVTPSQRLHEALKVPPVLFDLAVMPLILVTTRRVARLAPDAIDAARSLGPVRWLEGRGLAAQDTLGLAAAALFAFSPAVIYDSAVWAQSESMISFFMLAAILALASGRVGLGWALWTAAFVIKPQPIVIVPALVAFTFWRFQWSGLLRGALGVGAGGVLTLGYIVLTGNARYIWEVYQTLFDTFDRHISINAWNVWWIGHLNGLRASDTVVPLGPVSLTVEGISFLLLVLATLATLAYLNVRRDLVGLLVSCSMLKFAFYLFPISTHERYLYPLFVFLAPLVVLRPRWLALYVPLAGIFFLNVFFAAPSDPDMFETYLESDFGMAMSVVNVAVFTVTAAWLLWQALREQPFSDFVRAAAGALVPASFGTTRRPATEPRPNE